MQRGRAGTVPVPSVLVLMAVALAGLNAPNPALAQAPGPESFAQEPRTPMELWMQSITWSGPGRARKLFRTLTCS